MATMIDYESGAFVVLEYDCEGMTRYDPCTTIQEALALAYAKTGCKFPHVTNHAWTMARVEANRQKRV
jgi:hypothetical protein